MSRNGPPVPVRRGSDLDSEQASTAPIEVYEAMKKILLVDDSSTMLMSMESVLQRAGFQVDTAGSGEAALGKVDGFQPDLMITDLNMPGMDGLTLVREAKKKPGMRFKPVLMLTTESRQDKRDEARAAGATGWLVKPVQADDLLNVVRQVLPGA